jgi:hypothetical protein
MALRRLGAALGALLLCGCEVYAVPSPLPCPGELKGTFDFAADQVVKATDCFFAQPGNPAYQVNNPIAFPGTISFATDGTSDAALCVGYPHAQINTGFHTDLDVTVGFLSPLLNVGACPCPSQKAADAGKCLCQPNDPQLQNCSCPVNQMQWIDGTLVKDAQGAISTFQGNLTYVVVPPGDLPPSDVCLCQVRCEYSYALAGKLVGTR